MSQSVEADLRYPIGRFRGPQEVTADLLNEWIGEIEMFPRKLSDAVDGLNEGQLNTPYRPGGWTVRQVVHHCADSHVNSYIRYRLALTEDSPRIKAYDEAAWAELADAKTSPIDTSQELLRHLHARWSTLLRSMPPADFARGFEHPENGLMRLDWTTGLYAWHSRHHVAHISALRQRQGW